MKIRNLENGIKIFNVLSKRSNAYFIITKSKNYLIDTGDRRSRKELIKNIQATGNHQIHSLILTHSHYDHCANTAYFKKMFNCEVFIGQPEDSNVKTGFTPLPKGTNTWGRFMYSLGKVIGEHKFEYKPFSPDHIIKENRILNKTNNAIEVISTPGHTAGSVSIIINKKVAIVGDTMFGIFANSVFPPFANDIPVLLKSWKLLLDTGCEQFLPGHGKALDRTLVYKEYKKYSTKYG